MENNSQAKARTINCKGCGAPINLFGGHKIESVICSSCGSCLDCYEDYKVIAKYKNLKRPRLPLKMGMSGKIKNIEFIVTGIVMNEEIDEDGRYVSVEYQLYSPTHGYAWLVRDDNFNYSFMREVKDLPNIIVGVPEKNGVKFKVKDMQFTVKESGNENIFYVEGELTWVAKLHDSSKYTTAICSPYIYEITKSHNELEFSFGEFISAEEVYKTFNIPGTPIKSKGKHLAAPPTPVNKARSSIKIFAIISFLIMLAILIFGGGKRIFNEKIATSQCKEGVVKEFYIQKPGSLMKFKLHCPLSNAWTYFEVTVSKDGHDYFTIGKEISYYHGYSGGESWSEGSKSTSAYFRLPEQGMYELHISAEGKSGMYSAGSMQNKPLRISIMQGVMISRYFIILTIILIILAFPAELKSIGGKLADASDD